MSQTRPSSAMGRIVYQVRAYSHQEKPLRAARWKRWWLLCQPSPTAKKAVKALLRDSSTVSKRREPNMWLTVLMQNVACASVIVGRQKTQISQSHPPARYIATASTIGGTMKYFSSSASSGA